MIDAVETIKDWLVDSGLVTDYKIQADQFKDSNVNTDKFLILYPNGGLIDGSLQENPGVRLLIMSGVESPSRGAGSIMQTALDIIDYSRVVPEFGCLALIQVINMPSGVGRSENRRAFLELNFLTIIK
ncbi:MAG: hypothetical protein COA43_14750 [Robiginitomaculum sp.]|nr:MAG: hypothetical protein COA43_14750 [Robiginitomaculum sp.]